MASSAARPLKNAASAAVQAGASTSKFAPRSWQQPSATEERRYVLLRNIPRSVLSNDLLRALKDAGAVEPSFSIENIVAEPPYLPPPTPSSPPSPFRTFHITTPTAGHASELRSFLFNRSLFPHSTQTVELVSRDRREWAQNWIDRASLRSQRAGRETDGEHMPQPINVDWLLKPGFRGRRVLITGLPGKVARSRIEVLASGCEMQNLTKIPPLPRSLFSAHILTFPSVALAYKFHRKVHMTHYDRKNWNNEFLIRSEVQW